MGSSSQDTLHRQDPENLCKQDMSENKLQQVLELTSAGSQSQMVFSGAEHLGQFCLMICMKGLSIPLEDKKLDRSVAVLKCRKSLQRDLDRLDQWVEASSIRFNKAKCQGHNTLMQYSMSGNSG